MDVFQVVCQLPCSRRLGLWRYAGPNDRLRRAEKDTSRGVNAGMCYRLMLHCITVSMPTSLWPPARVMALCKSQRPAAQTGERHRQCRQGCVADVMPCVLLPQHIIALSFADSTSRLPT
jgi:hypothetical protein